MKHLLNVLTGLLSTVFLIIVWVFTLGAFDLIQAIRSVPNIAITCLLTIVGIVMVFVDMAESERN